MGLSRISSIGDGTLNSIALYMQLGIFLTQGIIIKLGLEKIRQVRSKMDCMSALGAWSQMRWSSWRYTNSLPLSLEPQVPLANLWLRQQEILTNQVNNFIVLIKFSCLIFKN